MSDQSKMLIIEDTVRLGVWEFSPFSVNLKLLSKESLLNQ